MDDGAMKERRRTRVGDMERPGTPGCVPNSAEVLLVTGDAGGAGCPTMTEDARLVIVVEPPAGAFTLAGGERQVLSPPRTLR